MIKSAARSGIANTEKYRSMAAGHVASNEYLIETIVTSSPVSSVTFDLSSHSGTFKHLRLCVSAQGTTANDNVDMSFNNDSGSNYNWHTMYGIGNNTVSVDFSLNRSSIPQCPPVAISSDLTFSTATIDILDAFSTSKFKTIRNITARPNTTGTPFTSLDSAYWASNSAITSIKLQGRSYNINTNSRFSLYGITG